MSESLQRMLRPIRVSLDVLRTRGPATPTFEAWTFGNRWNGWTVPYFEKAEADRIASNFNAGRGTTVAWYDALEDAYVFVDEDGEEEFFTGDVVGGRLVYAIGAGVWAWNEVG